MGTFLFGCVVFFSIAGIVMFLDRKKEQKEGPTGNETQVGEPVFVPDAATLALAERMKNNLEEFARFTQKMMQAKNESGQHKRDTGLVPDDETVTYEMLSITAPDQISARHYATLAGNPTLMGLAELKDE